MSKQQTFVDGLTDIFVKNNVVSADKAKAIKKLFWDRAKPQFVDFLLEEGLVSKSDLLNALSQYYKVPAFDVVGHLFKQHFVHMFPKDFLIRNKIIPLERDENFMVVIASDPGHAELLAKIGEHVSYDIRFNVGIAQDIRGAVESFYDMLIPQTGISDDVVEDPAQQEELEGFLTEDIED